MPILCHVAQFRAHGLQFTDLVAYRLQRSDQVVVLLSAVPGKLWRAGQTRSAGAPFRAAVALGQTSQHRTRAIADGFPSHRVSVKPHNTALDAIIRCAAGASRAELASGAI